MKTLSGRAALITGGLTGQGFAIAEALAAEGANVAVGSYVGASKGRAGDAAAYPELGEIGCVQSVLADKDVKVYANHLDIRDTAVIKMPAGKKPECEDVRHGGTVRLETFDMRRPTS